MKTALVTGGSKGIGLFTVLRFLELGYKVITCSRSERNWLDALSSYPVLKNVDFQEADISSDIEVKKLFEHIENKYQTLTAVVNNASPTNRSAGSYKEVDVAFLKETLNADFWSHALCLRYELNLMEAGSSIVNVSSINGVRPIPGAAMYGAAKHALESLTKSLALEAIESGVRINSVAPGVTWTNRWEERRVNNPNIHDDVKELVPIKRFALIDEIVDAIEFLTSDKASYVVGQTIVVDGGITLA